MNNCCKYSLAFPFPNSMFYFSLILFSCTEEINISGLGGDTPPYVANSILYADSVAKVYLSRASYTNEQMSHESVGDAVVYIVDAESQTKELLVFTGQYYEGGKKLEVGKNYLLEIALSDGAMLMASSYIPHPVHTFSSNLIVGGSLQMIAVHLNDPLTTTNYYEIFFYQIQHDFSGGDTVYSILKTVSEDEIILAEGMEEVRLYSHLFSDEGSNGKEINLKFDFVAPNPFEWKVYVVLNSVSKDYYDYKKSLYRHLHALSIKSEFSTDDLYDPAIFKTLSPVYSNIEGGKGIFSGISKEVKHAPCNLVGYECQ